MLYELLMGKTPFHAYEMKDLLSKINEGKYDVTLKEPITVETTLFLLETLQSEEKDRIKDAALTEHPFINDDKSVKLLPISGNSPISPSGDVGSSQNILSQTQATASVASETDHMTSVTLNIKDKKTSTKMRSHL